MAENSNLSNMQPPFSAPTSPSLQWKIDPPPSQRPRTPYPSYPSMQAAGPSDAGYSQQGTAGGYSDEDFLLIQGSQEATPHGANFLHGVQIPNADLDFGLDPHFLASPFNATAFDNKDFEAAYGEFALFDAPEQHYAAGQAAQPPMLPPDATDDTTFLRRELHDIEEKVEGYKTR
jgi:hypothetical protein